MTVVAGGLITLEYALEGLNYGAKQSAPVGDLSARDADVASYIRAVTPVIESLTGPLLSATVTRTFNGGKTGILLADRITSAASVSAVQEDGVPIIDFIVDADAGIIYAGTSSNRRRFSPGIQNITVDMTVGLNPIPDALQLAARALVVKLLRTKNAAPSFDTMGADGSQLVPDDFLIPREVRGLCAPYRQAGFA